MYVYVKVSLAAVWYTDKFQSVIIRKFADHFSVFVGTPYNNHLGQ